MLYTAEKLLAAEGLKWITRVPETIKVTQALLVLPDERIAWQDLGKGYRIYESSSSYGGKTQRWLLVHSDQAYKQEKKTFDRRIKKEEEALGKALWHLGNEIFSCEEDALKLVKLLQKNIVITKSKHKSNLLKNLVTEVDQKQIA